LDLRTFDQWRTDEYLLVFKKQQKVMPAGQTSPALNAQRQSLELLLCEHEVLDALLAEPVELERAQAYSQIHSIHSLSKNAFESTRRLLEQKSEHDTTLHEYIKADIEYKKARKDYYGTLEEARVRFGTSNPNKSSAIQELYTLGIAKKRIFQACQEKLNLNYGSLEKVQQLQQQCLIASHAMAKSGSFFQQKATALEHLLIECSEQEEISCYNHQATTLDLLAQDHLSLAQAITEENTAIADHTKKLISFAEQAQSAFERQLSISQQIKQAALPSYIANNYRKSFRLLEEAGHCFLSGYQLLKDQGPSMPDHESSDSYHRGLNLMNTAFVFQLPLIPHELRANYHTDWLAAFEEAQHHAESVIQTAPLEKTRLYHEKIASFLYQRISVLNHYFETLYLKQSINSDSHSSYFLEQAALLFLESSNRFQQLSQLSRSQLELPETELLTKATVETKSQASRLLLQTKALLFPSSAALVANQNQDLH